MRIIAAATLALTVLAGQAEAGARGDMHTGQFNGQFCNQHATYEIRKKTPGRRIFRGRVIIHDTGRHDDVVIEQFRDKSLKITRYLSGSDTGKAQWVYTFPPAFMKRDGNRFARFDGTRREGFNCPSGSAQINMPY